MLLFVCLDEAGNKDDGHWVKVKLECLVLLVTKQQQRCDNLSLTSPQTAAVYKLQEKKKSATFTMWHAKEKKNKVIKIFLHLVHTNASLKHSSTIIEIKIITFLF